MHTNENCFQVLGYTPATPSQHTSRPFLSQSTPTLYNFKTTFDTSFNSTTPPGKRQTASIQGQKTRKRKSDSQPLGDALSSLNADTPPTKRRAYQPRRTPEAKLDVVFDALNTVGWTLGDFLYYTFRRRNEEGEKVKRSKRHAMYASNFLKGNVTYPPAMILEFWYRSSDGRVSNGLSDKIPLFSLTQKYTEIKPAHAALTAFAAQIVEKKLGREVSAVVEPSNGLHATTKKRGTQKIEWQDIGDSTASRVEEIIRTHQPLTWSLMNTIASGKKVATNSENCKRRPPEAVCTHAIASLDFARNNEARLLPLTFGILAFALSAPADLMAYASRIGLMPSYSTVYNCLKNLADHESTVTLAHAKDLGKWGFLQFDNVQNYARQLDPRIGRTHRFNIGVAATYCELEGVDPAAGDVDDKRRRVQEDKRAKVTVDYFLSLIDHQHLDTVFSLHWLRVLINGIPQLAKWKEHVSMLFRSKAARLPLPVQPTKVHPLASSGKNETITTELKDALVDFFSQMGQTESDYSKRIILAGGDGLTFQKMLELQRYLQFHPDPFQRFELLEPVLSLWHTEWTDLSRVFETHWDGLLSQDPSSLGHSAARINRAEPTNLKKVDYYAGADLMYLVLEARMLDCWRNYFKCDDIFQHFDKLEGSSALPQIEDLVSASLKLHRAFSSTRAIYQALDDPALSSDWTDNVHLGSPWSAPPVLESSRTSTEGHASSKNSKRKRSKKPAPPAYRHPSGDRVLANSITFMRDALFSRELAYAIAEGDVGRVYEVLKVLLFTFSGSSHTKYSTYLLEMITRLELESSTALKEAVLRSTVINLSGHEGSFSAADFIQEFFNRLLEAIVEWKGVEYADTFIRQVISRNLHHFARIKLDLRVGVGLAPRSSRHSAPHLKPEFRILLKTYKDCELHLRRPGRVYMEVNKDNFQQGMTQLADGKLKRWVAEMTRTRNLLYQDGLSKAVNMQGTDPVASDSEDDEIEEDTQDTLAMGHVVDGEYVLSAVELHDDEVDKWVVQLEHENRDEDTGAESDSEDSEEDAVDT